MCVFAVCLPPVGAARTDGKENTKVISDLAAWSDSSWHVGTKNPYNWHYFDLQFWKNQPFILGIELNVLSGNCMHHTTNKVQQHLIHVCHMTLWHPEEATPDSRRLRSGIESILRDQEDAVAFFAVVTLVTCRFLNIYTHSLKKLHRPCVTKLQWPQAAPFFQLDARTNTVSNLRSKPVQTLDISWSNGCNWLGTFALLYQGFFCRNVGIPWSNFLGCSCSVACDCKCPILIAGRAMRQCRRCIHICC